MIESIKNGDVMNKSNHLHKEETKYYPTLDDGYVSSIDKKMDLKLFLKSIFQKETKD